MRFPRPLACAVVLATCSAFVAGCNDSGADVTLVRPTPTGANAADATPDVEGTPIASVAVDALAAKLLGGAEPLPGLPAAKYRVDSTESLGPEDVPRMPKLVRAIRLTIAGPDAANTVTFYLHASPEDAASDLSSAVAGPIPATQMNSLGYQGRVVNEGGDDGQTGTTRILVAAGQTVIEATSTVAGADPEGNFMDAYELASIALNFLLSVTN